MTAGGRRSRRRRGRRAAAAACRIPSTIRRGPKAQPPGSPLPARKQSRSRLLRAAEAGRRKPADFLVLPGESLAKHNRADERRFGRRRRRVAVAEAGAD